MDNHQLADISSFHLKFNQSYAGIPRFLPDELAQFRLKFMGEELQEIAHAMGYELTYTINKRETPPTHADLALMLDGLVDLDYVLKGTVHLCGFSHAYAEAWDRVQFANMSKELSHAGNPGTRGLIGIDVVKPPGWRPADLTDLIMRS